MNITPVSLTAAALYFATGGAVAMRLFGNNDKIQPGRTLTLGLGVLAIILHSWLLYKGLFTASGINLGFFNAASLAAWIMVLVLLVSSFSKPVENLGILFFPAAGLVILSADFFPTTHFLNPESSWALQVHVITSLLAYSLLALAAVQALLLSVQDRHLRKHHPGGFVRVLPPLQTMESLLFEMIAIGFILLSVALLSGFLFLEDLFAQKVAHKTVLSIFAWIAFAILLWGRFMFGWRGRTAIRWTLGGFVFLMLAYFGSKAVLEFILA